jgi:transcriptional regulator with GAF, ATPase, and Fis domain
MPIMPVPRSIFAFPVAEFASTLLARQEVIPRAQAIADQNAELMEGTAVVVYVITDPATPSWTPKATAGEVAVTEILDFDTGMLGKLAEIGELVNLEDTALQREQYAHLDIRRTVVGLAYVPLLAGDNLIAAIELINYEQPFPPAMLDAVNELAALAAPAIAGALAYEAERNTNLHSISRVTQMYDLEKVFNSTLEMDELLGTIANKFLEVMNVQAVNLWMVNGDVLELMAGAGFDPTVQLGGAQQPGEGIAGDISDSGEAVLCQSSCVEGLWPAFL